MAPGLLAFFALALNLAVCVSAYTHHHSMDLSNFFHNSGCDHPDRKNHLIALLTDWHTHHDIDAIFQFYYDLALIDLASNSQTMGKRWTNPIHDEAYNNHDTTPDIKHLEEYAKTQMNAACRIEVLKLIERFEHPSSPAPTTQPPATTTHAHHHHHTTHPTTPAPVTHQQHTTHPNTHHPHTTQPATTTTTPKPTTPKPTTAAPIVSGNQFTLNKCDPMLFVTALARGDIVTDPRSSYCSDGKRDAPESLILQTCNAPAPSTWKQGMRVMDDCSKIPRYTPVSNFLLGTYSMDGTGLAGVLVDCTADGFKMGVQVCGHPPQVYAIHLGGADPRQNANSFYTLQW